MEEDLRTERESCVKSRLVDEICSISKRSSLFCHHHHHCHVVRSRKVRFINWYHVLGVEETDSVHVIKKRYHKLALQLHPDKNKHSKAEFAFKLVSEAYVCLSDSTKRGAFDLEKLTNFCYECNNARVAPSPAADSPKKPPIFSERSSKSQRTISSSLKDIRERFREEAKVIENCLKANSLLSKKELPPFNTIPNDNNISSSDHLISCRKKELPVFDPAHYAFHGYPHLRTRVNTEDEFRYFGGGGVKKRTGRNYPLFGGATENSYNENNGRISISSISRSRSTCVRS